MELYRAYGLLFLSSIFVSYFLFHVPATSASGVRMGKENQTSPPVVDSSQPHAYHSQPLPAHAYSYHGQSGARPRETCSAAPEEFIYKIIHARRQDCESLAADCKVVAISRGISDTNCEDCKRKCLNPAHQITETCSAAPMEFIERLLTARRQDCESIAAECKTVAVFRGISETNCEDCKRKCLNPPEE